MPAPAAGVLREILLDTDAEAVPGAVLGADRGRRTKLPFVPERRPRVAAAGNDRACAPRPSPGTDGDRRPAFPPRSGAPAAARHRSRRASRAPAATAGSPARTSIARSRRRRRSASASPRPPSRASSTRTDIPHDRMRLDHRREHGARGRRGAARHRRVRSGFLAHRRRAHKAAIAETGVKLSYTAYIVKAAAEAMAVAPAINGRWETDRSRFRRRSTSASAPRLARRGWSSRSCKDAGTLEPRSGSAPGSTSSPRRARDGKLDARRRLGRQLHHLQPRRVGLAARGADHPPPGAGGDPRHRQAREARRRPRGRRRTTRSWSGRWPM